MQLSGLKTNTSVSKSRSQRGPRPTATAAFPLLFYQSCSMWDILGILIWRLPFGSCHEYKSFTLHPQNIFDNFFKNKILFTCPDLLRLCFNMEAPLTEAEGSDDGRPTAPRLPPKGRVP